jgi:ribonucleotide monophosphatase NagD (HAD superfamily)
MKLLLDLDGTLLDGNAANGDSVEFMAELRRRGIDFRVMTNSVKAPPQIRARLGAVGIDVPAAAILNPIGAINERLRKDKIERAFIVGSAAEIEQVEAVQDAERPQAILLLDFEKENADYAALSSLGASAAETTVVGDDWSTDIAGAAACGCRGVLIRTGKYRAGDELRCSPARTIDRLMELLE